MPEHPGTPLPGFGYSPAHAHAIALALQTTLDQAGPAGASVPDRLAAIAEVAATVIRASRLRDNPGAAARAIAAYVLAAVKLPPAP